MPDAKSAWGVAAGSLLRPLRQEPGQALRSRFVSHGDNGNRGDSPDFLVIVNVPRSVDWSGDLGTFSHNAWHGPHCPQDHLTCWGRVSLFASKRVSNVPNVPNVSRYVAFGLHSACSRIAARMQYTLRPIGISGNRRGLTVQCGCSRTRYPCL